MKVAQYMAYWGDQLLPGPVYKEWWKSCVAIEGEECGLLEEQMDVLIGNNRFYFGSVLFSYVSVSLLF